MSASKVEVVVLHCDQGMGTLIKIYERVGGGEPVTHLALIDLGSETKTKRFATDAIDEVMVALGQMQAPRIDLLILSHQDTDHWSLLPDLEKRIASKWGSISIGAFYRGGARWRAGALTTVKEVERSFDVTSEPLPRDYSDYDDPKAPPGKIGELAGVAFRVLAVNSPVTRSADDLIRNGTSAVMVVEFAGQKVVLPGDATADTIGRINQIFAKWSKGPAKKNPVTPCFLIGAPHHGSLRTLAGNFTTTKPNLELGRTFANELKPARVAASAGYLSQFHHPFLVVMNLLGRDAEQDDKFNRYVAWNDEVDTWRVIVTKRKIHTTICNLDDPPLRKTWVFTIASSGELSIGSVSRGGRPDPDVTPRHAARPH